MPTTSAIAFHQVTNSMPRPIAIGQAATSAMVRSR
jgi:hypothetical protein